MKTYGAIIETMKNNNTPTNHMKKVAKNIVFVFGEDTTAPHFFFFDYGEDKTPAQYFFVRRTRRQNSAPICF